MRIQHYSSVILLLIILIKPLLLYAELKNGNGFVDGFDVGFNIDAKNGKILFGDKIFPLSTSDFIGLFAFNGYYGLHFLNYYAPLDYTEVQGQELVTIRFASYNADNRNIYFRRYLRGRYVNCENDLIDTLNITRDRSKRTFLEHDIMYMALSSYPKWGENYVKLHTIPIGSCKTVYEGSNVHNPISVITFNADMYGKSYVCICFVSACDAKPVVESCDLKSLRCTRKKLRVDPPPFCEMFDIKNIVTIVPLAFSKQTFFKPGAKLYIRSGSEEPYVMDLYVKSHKIGEKSTYNVEYKGIPYVFQVYKKGRDTVCVDYTDNNVPEDTVCVPSPSLMRPKISSNGDGIKIKYQDCQDSPDCDINLPVGTHDKNLLFSVIKPKINKDDYTLLNEYKCADGQLVHDPNKCTDPDSAHMLGYANDDNGNVTCVVDMPFVPTEYSLKKGNRNLWLRENKKMLQGYGIVVENTADGKRSEKYVQCDYKYTIDIASLTQAQLAKVRTMRSIFFNIPGHYNPKDRACQGSVVYKYDSNRLYEKVNGISCKDVTTWNDGPSTFQGCSSLYINDDDFTNFFHENSNVKNIKPLNPILQGMCVSNFPSSTYGIRENRKVLPTSYALRINKKKTSCDFIKIEAWGGGESGSVGSAKSGKAGNYVMGILKLDKDMMDKRFIIDVGAGGKGDRHLSNAGNDTSVKLCTSDNGSDCVMSLIAQGGSKGDDYLQDKSSGTNLLAHYRLFSGHRNVKEDEILIPYQNPDLFEGKILKQAEECMYRNLELEKNSNKYPGAGGCSDVHANGQEGANGIVKLTCEKWSGTPGTIEFEDENACNAALVTFIEEINHSKDYLPEKVKEFLKKISQISVCRELKSLPKLVSSLSEYFVSVKALLTGTANYPALIKSRKSLLAELDNNKVKEALKKVGIDYAPDMTLLYIDALVFNFGSNVLNKPGQYLLNYYVAANDDSSVDVDSKVVPDELAFAMNATNNLSKSRDFSVKISDQQFIKKYRSFIEAMEMYTRDKKPGHNKENNNVVMSWMYSFFKADKHLFDMYAHLFVELMLGMNLTEFIEWYHCSENILQLFKEINQYKKKLPLRVQNFITKISGEDKFCSEMSRYVEVNQLLYNYIGNMKHFVNSILQDNVNNFSLMENDMKSLVDQWRNFLGNSDIRNVFARVGVTENNDEIRLLFDAAVLNSILSESNASEGSILDQLRNSRVGKRVFSLVDFPARYLSMLQDDCNMMECGDNGIYRFDIVSLWTFVAFHMDNKFNDKHFEYFIKLMLDQDLQKLSTTSEKSTEQILAELIDNIKKYRNKLPEVTNDFIDKISTHRFSGELVQLPELVDLLHKYEMSIRDFIKGLVDVSNDDIINSLGNISTVYKELGNTLNKESVKKAFANAGITNSVNEIRLLFDAVIINYLLSDLTPFKKLLIDVKTTSSIDRKMLIMQSMGNVDLSVFKQDVMDNAYGEYSSHRFNILVLWCYMINNQHYYRNFTERYFNPFVKLVLGENIKESTSEKRQFTGFINKISKYKEMLPDGINDFIAKISTKEFYNELIQSPELIGLLNKEETLMRDFIKELVNLSNNGVINAMDNISQMTQEFNDILKTAKVKKIFANIGLTKYREVRLLFDAVIINYLLAELSPFKKLVIDVDKTPYLQRMVIGSMMEVYQVDLSVLKQDILNKYGKYSSHRFDMIVLWSYMFYMAYYYYDFADDYFNPFVKFVLGDRLPSLRK
ncbi:hypothetical protein EDL79_04490 [Ehrlichia ruminantium]|uniref:Glycine-rich domain-containing protein n=1 Tax=Ehrlichia ruminantium TaxID=779 RepID=A0AAE6UIU1_EHRRU|nr:hypothetical protein [Ehrlichia ruminantium]QGR03790.1 hypothetical protein EDL80_04480 [Ehrlichia ruminantium]QGR04717.1 hypothetical protein EDL79_04490 [Ehrlichia ruminantium]